jgi:hypothetical protein
LSKPCNSVANTCSTVALAKVKVRVHRRLRRTIKMLPLHLHNNNRPTGIVQQKGRELLLLCPCLFCRPEAIFEPHGKMSPRLP